MFELLVEWRVWWQGVSQISKANWNYTDYSDHGSRALAMTRWLSYRHVRITGVPTEAFGDEADDLDFVVHGEVQFSKHIMLTPHRCNPSHIIEPVLDCARRKALNPVVIKSDKFESPATLLVLVDDDVVQLFNFSIPVIEARRGDPQSYLWALWIWRDMEGAEFRCEHNHTKGDMAWRLMPPLGAVLLHHLLHYAMKREICSAESPSHYNNLHPVGHVEVVLDQGGGEILHLPPPLYSQCWSGQYSQGVVCSTLHRYCF